jgi:uncharacterized OsmC-like protein
MNDLAMKTERIVNGVNVDDVEALVGAIQQDASLATSHFRLTNKWIGGGHNQSRITGFYSGGQDHEHRQEFLVDADEPPVLAGRDIAANPVEYLLSSLTACLTTALIYHAAVRGIEVRSLEADVEGDLDLRGFLGLTNEVRRGFQNIRVRYRVDTDPENVEVLAELMKLSPVYDVTRNGTDVDVSMARM